MSLDTCSPTKNSSKQDSFQALLKLFITSVEGLQQDVKQLRSENALQTAEIERLKESSGGAFNRFPKLPLELQNLIWTFALTAPQTHIVTRSIISRSNVNIVMQSCRTARSLGLKLQLPCFQIMDSQVARLGDPPPCDHKQYMNLHLDTLWFADSNMWPNDFKIFSPE